MSMNGTGMEIMSFPFLPIISPCCTYLRRFALIFPRTICFEARVVLVDFQRHVVYSLASPRAKMLATKLSTSVEQISQ